MKYYDLVLGLIPFGLATIAAALYLFGFDLTTAVPAGSVFAAACIGHAMFVRSPTDPVAPETTDHPAYSAD